MGGMIVGEELIKVIWGPAQIPLPLPEALRGSFLIGDAAIEKYRLLAVVDRPGRCSPRCCWTLNRTKIGLLIRAGVQDREMVESARLPHPRACSSACSSPARRSPAWAACCGGCTSRS